MDKFTSRRRATWQSKAPLWPFLAAALALAVGGGVLVSLYASGVLLGDGTSSGRAVVWIKTLSNIVIPAVLIGGAVGGLLNGVFLSPARRDGALKWSGVLMLAAAFAAAPMSVVKGMEADRLGYEIRLKDAVARARISSRQSELDFYRRMHLLVRHQGFGIEVLRTSDGLDKARTAIAGHKDLIAAARRDYDKGQADARAALAAVIADEADREAVLVRFDTAQIERKALMEKIWGIHDSLVALSEEEVNLLYANRGRWRPNGYGGGTVDSLPLLNQLRRIGRDRSAASHEHDQLYSEIATLDAETNAGIDRVIEAAIHGERPLRP
ncbi:hypothetical protein N0B44_20495 [Roseibacterium beibuensis]|uniref:hypothetical protein n=1 Tax=[Roseibacterium] beibuensis TaxID=1193142 RepID=UPI00217CEED8|nr:hypothetical protein [Roseibacterium beibuensis]MCS6625295.1 hypothetical protein [Roseibacterium beibuensis]